ncbi:hypothetical protein GTP56_05385 [Duganella sp. FT134W]|uniref:ADP ribosyltransferase domain-containing protein n=1 Tax=Duganella margarita TaxID=2692170 RepID=A0A7X4GYZ8_9BURK|nr:hypothetical protein [Duganella margarita]MYM71629.1 hypothetical protein [Duganella margarita]
MKHLKISSKLPNPDSLNDPLWTQWDEFIAKHQLPISNEEVVRRYQNVEQQSSTYEVAADLNHFLNLRHFGKNSRYAKIAQEQYLLDEDDYAIDASVQALDDVFSKKACRFSEDSLVFKGVSLKPFYLIHSFRSIDVGQEVHFPGYVSVSVCREKALDFAFTDGVLLVIQGLDLVDCIVPPNSKVATTAGADVPEHEIVLQRDVTMVVERIIQRQGKSHREVHLKVIERPD